MIVAIQQPEHLPWMGFFDKMQRCDLYVYLDNVQFKKRYFENRNKIRTQNGWQWVTVPVISKGKYRQNINEVEIDNSQNWRRKYLGSIKSSYSKSPHFDHFYPGLESVIEGPCRFLSDLNIRLVQHIREYLKIRTPVQKASDLGVDEFSGSELIYQICNRLGAATYMSGPDGRNYLNADHFEKNGIKIIFHDFDHPVYHQCRDADFFSHMSVIDYIFANGSKQF
jgi:WbqC-like protein